ncbi:hypothetical protein Bca52824_037401 [Brassica carinata]|uniref:Uncharacterized protein n=1 Tax=Brassica carinata TaxID=52824 RepID=A0A8X7V3I6_BRACI|nr:hypothetical protein Bca52824_037401 [Brassica carinata]
MDESAIKGVEGLELNGSDAAIRKSSSPPREGVEEALRKHFASRGIKLIHASAPEVDYRGTILCRFALIYVNEEDGEKALKLDGSDMGAMAEPNQSFTRGRGSYLPYSLPPSATAWEDVFYELRLTLLTAIALSISWLLPKNKTNTYSARCMLQDLVRVVFPRSGCFVFGDGCCVVYLHGDAIGKALKLSGGSVGGFKIVVHEGVEGLELNGSDAAIRKAAALAGLRLRDTTPPQPPREGVEEALRKHFASRGIKLIHASAPEVDYRGTILCRFALIYVNEEDGEKALKLDGSDMGAMAEPNQSFTRGS